eukprot:TRINITY_DN4574_c0_g1_i1.p1 TRINITY_DN4574_c0_g1~~TRINITY_DN4574_c0_g1_i1.p1  ORF type:complete len:353 (-),score=67.39 TRINITY_DN4574_c0_g1_i1:77-1135(-)
MWRCGVRTMGGALGGLLALRRDRSSSSDGSSSSFARAAPGGDDADRSWLGRCAARRRAGGAGVLLCQQPYAPAAALADAAGRERQRSVRVYLTGFGPFGGVLENPTSIVCRILREYLRDGVAPEGVSPELLEEFALSGICVDGLDALEVSAEASRENSRSIVARLTSTCPRDGEERSNTYGSDSSTTPAAIVHLGVSSAADSVNLECRGVNVADFRIPDVRGWQARGVPVVAGAPPVLYTSLRLPEILGEMRDRGVRCDISTDAGRYLCNYIFFLSLHAARPANIPVLFVHVPPFEKLGCSAQVSAVLCLLLALARQLSERSESDVAAAKAVADAISGDAVGTPPATTKPMG